MCAQEAYDYAVIRVVPRVEREEFINAGIVVSRVLGLRNLTELAPTANAADAPAWHAQRWMDGDGNAWQEIDLPRLAHDPGFLQVGA